MVNKGLATELINAQKVSISDGTDTFLQLQELNFDLSHPETIEETTNETHYFYGHQQAFFEGTILASKNEWALFVDKCQLDANGAAVTNNWAIAYTSLDGIVKTFGLTGTMAPNLRGEKPVGGAVKMRFRIRVTELVTSADIT